MMSLDDSDTSSTSSGLEVNDGGICNGQEGVIAEMHEINNHQQTYMSKVQKSLKTITRGTRLPGFNPITVLRTVGFWMSLKF